MVILILATTALRFQRFNDRISTYRFPMPSSACILLQCTLDMQCNILLTSSTPPTTPVSADFSSRSVLISHPSKTSSAKPSMSLSEHTDSQFCIHANSHVRSAKSNKKRRLLRVIYRDILTRIAFTVAKVSNFITLCSNIFSCCHGNAVDSQLMKRRSEARRKMLQLSKNCVYVRMPAWVRRSRKKKTNLGVKVECKLSDLK